MAIYHMQAKVVSRGKGRSAVAASAYMSCSSVTNEYDGVHHDYTRKKGLMWERVFLPENAPVVWQDRAILWNAVEDAEKSKDSRLAREFVVALPRELNADQQITLLTEYIQQQFVADGMCADVGIHDPDPPGHNPHAHILLTIRPLDEQGKWLTKLRAKLIVICYQIKTIVRSMDKRTATIQVIQPKLKRYNELTQQIRQKSKARKALVAEQKNTSKLNIFKQHDLSRQITTLTEEIEELLSEKENLLLDLGCADDAGVKAVQSEVTAMEASLHKLDEQKEKYSAELDETLQQYKHLQRQANADSDEIQRNAVTAASPRLQQAYGKRFDAQLLRDNQKEISQLTDPCEAGSSIREQLPARFTQS